MIKGIAKVLKTADKMDSAETAKEYITYYCNTMQNQAFEDAGQLLNDVRWYRSHNSNTMKNGRNPETHEVTDELKPVSPLKVTTEAAAYKYTPAVPEK